MHLDTVEVWGSSPHVPTILFKQLQASLREGHAEFDIKFNIDESVEPQTEGFFRLSRAARIFAVAR